MSIFNWFTSKQSAPAASVPDSSGLGHMDATVPLMPSDRMRVKQAPRAVNHAANRKNERLERRELLYGVVRDSMIRAGVLAASYKFKVLSLDALGQQYLIMMDLANQSAGDTGRLADIEAMIAQAAKARHDILVTAVYWRVNEHVAAGVMRSQTPHTPAQTPSFKQETEQPPHRQTAASAPPIKRVAPFEPLQQDEVVAFKRALAGATPAVPLSAPGQIVTSGRRNPAPPAEFEETQMIDSDESASPLGGTQYGDLN